MKSKSPNDSEYWQAAKEYFRAVGKPHLIGMIKRIVELRQEAKETVRSENRSNRSGRLSKSRTRFPSGLSTLRSGHQQ